MRDLGSLVKKSLQKRQAALERYRAIREAFVISEAKIKADIEESVNSWKKMMEQNPEK